MQIVQNVLAARPVALATTVTAVADEPVIKKPAESLDWWCPCMTPLYQDGSFDFLPEDQ